jgi:hypothetical protein
MHHVLQAGSAARQANASSLIAFQQMMLSTKAQPIELCMLVTYALAVLHQEQEYTVPVVGTISDECAVMCP